MTNKKFNELLIFFSLFAIPVYALYFGLKKSPFEYTFSMIGNWFEYKINFIIWGVVTAILLFIVIVNLYKKTKFKNKKAHQLMYSSLFFLILTVITPTAHSEPIQEELKSHFFYFNLHGFFAVLFGLFLLTSLFIFSRYTSQINKNFSTKSLLLLLTTVGGSVFTLFIFGMTGIFELFFFISLSAFLIVANFLTNQFSVK